VPCRGWYCRGGHERKGCPTPRRAPVRSLGARYTARAMPFFQSPPTLGNQYTDDSFLRSYLARTLPASMLREIEPELIDLGARAGGDLYAIAPRRLRRRAALSSSGTRGGNRIDRIEITPLTGRRPRAIAAEKGVVATAYEKKHGELSRIHQFALTYLFDGSTQVYTCPLAMTDGAAKTLLVPWGTARSSTARCRASRAAIPKTAWTSGQWMTERTGGSDVAISSASRAKKGTDDYLAVRHQVVHQRHDVADGAHARAPRGQPAGRAGPRALLRRAARRRRRPASTGSRSTASRTSWARAWCRPRSSRSTARRRPRAWADDGIKNITPMLNITRTWNSVARCTGMRRGLALARDYARKRVAFGAPLSRQAAARRHARGAAGRARGGVSAHVPRRGAAREGGGKTI
jgi:acyl-CoA dehydrogenase